MQEVQIGMSQVCWLVKAPAAEHFQTAAAVIESQYSSCICIRMTVVLGAAVALSLSCFWDSCASVCQLLHHCVNASLPLYIHAQLGTAADY
jgi:hypothetical protein